MYLQGAIEIPPQTADSNQKCFSWWRRNDTTGIYDSFSETLKYLDKTIREVGPVSGLVGFFQGAILTGLINGIQESTSQPFPDVEFLQTKNISLLTW